MTASKTLGFGIGFNWLWAFKTELPGTISKIRKALVKVKQEQQYHCKENKNDKIWAYFLRGTVLYIPIVVLMREHLNPYRE